MENAFREALKKKVGGSLRAIPTLQRLEMLRKNAMMLRKEEWKPPTDDGTLVRKTVGATR
jgi:phage portal protein BeeE